MSMSEQTRQALALLAAKRAKATSLVQSTNEYIHADLPPVPSNCLTSINSSGQAITLNQEQTDFVSLVLSGRSCVLLGKAGSGKTTAVNAAIEALLSSGAIPKMTETTGSVVSPKLLTGLPAIAGCAFTRRATKNLARNFPTSVQSHCHTVHALLEYQPHYTDGINDEGRLVTTMEFRPSRDASNQLPKELTTIFIDESSMLGIDLFSQLTAALAKQTQIIFIGDINQLAPVFGDSILGHVLARLPVVELTQIHRQALASPIITLAHRILEGKPIIKSTLEDFQKSTTDGITKLVTWKEGTTEQLALATCIAYLKSEYLKGNYKPAEDLVILPFNKKVGTVEVNKGIANWLDKLAGTLPTTVIGGWTKTYWAVGDVVLKNNELYTIVAINHNSKYRGVAPQQGLDRYGNRQAPLEATTELGIDHLAEFVIDSLTPSDTPDPDVVNESSHALVLIPDVVDTRGLSSDELAALSKSSGDVLTARGEINNLQLAYAITCHKAQGLEATKVYVFVHSSHNIMISREWLYTAVTRAKHELIVVCANDTFVKGINKQQVKGNDLLSKAEFFKGKQDAGMLPVTIDYSIFKGGTINV